MLEYKKSGNEKIDLNKIRRRFESSRIDGDEFTALYGVNYQNDMNLVSTLSEKFQANINEGRVGGDAELLLYFLFSQGRVSSLFDVRAANRFDDYTHGVDLVFDYKNGSVPGLATIDITVNQADALNEQRSVEYREESRPIGLDKKIVRIKDYTDRLSAISAEYARDISTWLQSGGLHESRNSDNSKLVSDVQKILLLKYYKAPKDSNEPNKSGYVIGGPQSIISLDNTFVNRALQGNTKAQEVVEALSFLEFVLGIKMEKEYIDKLLKGRKENSNLLFDTHYTKVNAWYRVITQSEISDLADDYVAQHRKDPEFVKQLQYFNSTYSRVFGLGK